jgi:hypothetical protein
MIQIKRNRPDPVQSHHTGRHPSTCPLLPTAGYSNSESQLQCFHVCWQQCLHHLYQALSNEQHAVPAATHLLVSQPTYITENTIKNNSTWPSTKQLNQSHSRQILWYLGSNISVTSRHRTSAGVILETVTQAHSANAFNIPCWLHYCNHACVCHTSSSIAPFRCMPLLLN